MRVEGIRLKKWVWTIIAVVVIAVAGGYAYANHRMTQQTYTAAMTAAKNAVQDKNYSVAEAAFQEALRHKSNDATAQRYLTQTQNFASAESAMSDSDFDSAKSDYTKVKTTADGYSILTQRANKALKQLKTIQLKEEMYQQIYDQAMTEYNGQSYTQSNATLDRIFKDSDAKQSYYTDIYNQAVDLRSANNKAVKGGGDGMPADDSSSTSAATTSSSSATTTSDSSTSSTVAGLTDSESAAAKNYKGSNEYTVPKSRTQLNGKTITATQITAARKTLKDAGIQPGSFSDQDIRDGLIAAKKAGTSFKTYAEKNYK